MTRQPACSKRWDHSMLLDSSKRARSSNRAVTSLPASAAAMKRLGEMRLACQAVQRDLDRHDGRVDGGLAQQLHERVHRLVRIVQQHLALGHLLDDGAVSLEACRPLRREGRLHERSCALLPRERGEAEGVAEVERHRGGEHLVLFEVESIEQKRLDGARQLGFALKTHGRETRAFLQGCASCARGNPRPARPRPPVASRSALRVTQMMLVCLTLYMEKISAAYISMTCSSSTN